MRQDDCFLGLDLSTQSLTAIVISLESGVIRQLSINFDQGYPRYGTRGGVPPSPDLLRVHVDPLMWVEALDDMLRLLQEEALTSRIAAVAVSAQQHGTVYLNHQAETILAGLDPAGALASGIAGIFSRKTCPIWMDSSTGRECREITAALGGDALVVGSTGSVATERFAGPQIRKFWKEDPEAYTRTAHIALISSFVTSLLVGRIAPVDAGDGYGTNLADIRSGTWSQAAMDAAAPGLQHRLPRLAAKDYMVDRVSPCMVKRFGFDAETGVVVGSGDNPCSLVGLGLIGNPNLHAVSLGTSDTCFGYMAEMPDVERTEGHIFGTADGHAMFLICFKNGSLARERVKDDFDLGWEDFSRILIRDTARKPRPGDASLLHAGNYAANPKRGRAAFRRSCRRRCRRKRSRRGRGAGHGHIPSFRLGGQTAGPGIDHGRRVGEPGTAHGDGRCVRSRGANLGGKGKRGPGRGPPRGPCLAHPARSAGRVAGTLQHSGAGRHGPGDSAFGRCLSNLPGPKRSALGVCGLRAICPRPGT